MEHGVVGLERLELSTSRLSGVRSNHLSYRPLCRRFWPLAASCSGLSRSSRSFYTPFRQAFAFLARDPESPATAEPRLVCFMLLLVNERVAHCK